jgi:hypothetical protein
MGESIRLDHTQSVGAGEACLGNQAGRAYKSGAK